MKYLKKFIANTWDGDVTFSEATKGFTKTEITKMDTACMINLSLVKDGMDFDFVPKTQGERLLAKLINKFED
jgi:hypothetical protein